MKDNPTSLEMLFEKAESYSKTTIELLKLNAIDKTAEIVSSLALRLVVFAGITLFTLIVNIGIALWIGEMLGKSYFGFFVVGGFYALLLVLLLFFRNQWVKFPISNSIIFQLMKKNEV